MEFFVIVIVVPGINVHGASARDKSLLKKIIMAGGIVASLAAGIDRLIRFQRKYSWKKNTPEAEEDNLRMKRSNSKLIALSHLYLKKI